MTDALDKLMVSENESIDLELLASIIGLYLKIIKESGELSFSKEFYKLKDWQKILIYLLGRKAIFLKKLKTNFIEETSYKDISDLFGIKESSVRKYASLELKGIIKSEKGNYKVPSYNLFKCEEVLKKK